MSAALERAEEVYEPSHTIPVKCIVWGHQLGPFGYCRRCGEDVEHFLMPDGGYAPYWRGPRSTAELNEMRARVRVAR